MRVQARITLPEALRAAIDAARTQWNPEVATGNPAHLTVVYHDEAPDPDLLRARLAHACRLAVRFPLDLGAVQQFRSPLSGAFVAVADPTDGIGRLRSQVLGAPFSARERFGLHVTLLHPAYGGRMAAAWPALSSLATAGRFVAEQIDVITGTRSETKVLASFALGLPL